MTRIAIVGLGKIATDQHVPTLGASNEFELVAVASPHDTLEGVRNFSTIEALLDQMPEVEAIALCTPPQARFRAARYALERGRHVLLEKPPCTNVSEALALTELARRRNRTLFASWHSRYAPAVDPARAWLAERRILEVRVTWKEDVRVWHPGQRWIWLPGGLGVFDPGINALSILTRLLPGPLNLKAAELSIPANCATPVAAKLLLEDARDAPVIIDLDFLQSGPPTWDIHIDTDVGPLLLSKGGRELQVDGKSMRIADMPEYAGLYSHFARLLAEERSDVDVSPLQIVADAFLCGRHVSVAPFVD